MNYNKTSRKDDLISMCYVLAYLCHGGELMGINTKSNLTENECFELALKTKRRSTIENLCFGNSESLNDFFVKIFSMECEEAPDYGKLKLMLISGLRPRQTEFKCEE